MQEPATRKQLVDRISAERADLNASFVDLPAAQMDEPGVAGHWSVKDMLVHVAWWEQQAVEKLRGKETVHDQLGGPDDEAQIDRVNDSVYRSHQTWPASQGIAMFDASGVRLLDALRSLEGEFVLANLDFIAENTYRHYPEHAEQIRTWHRARPSGGEN
jgi:hypothetical protein